jgi:hypothetical protein
MSFFYDLNKKLAAISDNPQQLNEDRKPHPQELEMDAKVRSMGIQQRADQAEKNLSTRRAEPKTVGQKVAKDIGGPLKKLAKGDIRGALSEEGNDGNLANNAKPYDKITRGDVIAGRLGKDEMGGKKHPGKSKNEAVEKTARGVVHKAGAGGYGRKFDTDEEGDEKSAKQPEAKRGRGRPKKGSDETGAVKKYDDDPLAQAMGVGKPPKSFKGKSIKHKMDEGDQLPSPPDEVHLPKKGSKHGPVDVYKKPKNEGADDIMDQGEYDQEGDMAKDQLHTLTKAAEELSSILDDDQDLPEWVQSKITKALEFINTSNDYMDQERHDSDDMNKLDEEPKSKNQAIAARIARGVQKGEVKAKPGSASAEMAKMKPKELNKFAKGSTKGLPKKVSKKKEEVEETTTAGAVATAPTSGKASKGGMQFGKGIYDSWNRQLETMIAESMNISMNMNSDSHGGPGRSLTVTATDEDAMKLAALLKMAGVGAQESGCGCGSSPCGCGNSEMVDENKPDWPTNTETSMDALQYSGGLNKPKTDVAGDGQTTVPVTAVHSADEDELRRMRASAGIKETSNPYPVGQDALSPQEKLNPTNNPNKSIVQGIKDFIMNPTKPAMEDDIEEAAKPDYIDLDKDGNKTEPMKQAAHDAKQSVKEDLQADDGEFYPSSDDFFGQFEADHFDNEVESDDGMEVRGYIDGVNVMAWRFNDESKTDGYGVYNDDALRDEFSESLAEMKRLWQYK